jgi:tetratricopeptide (TPR) repeat protein
MRTRSVPTWYGQWRPVFEALRALSKSEQVRTDGAKLKALREMAVSLGRSELVDDDAALFLLAAEIKEVVRSLHDRYDGSLVEDDAGQVILVWYRRVCHAQTTSEIALEFGWKPSYVKERTGAGRVSAAGWDGVKLVLGAVQLALAGSGYPMARVETSAAVFRFASLSDNARALVSLLVMLAPEVDLAGPLETLARNALETYPPIRAVLDSEALRRSAVYHLQDARVLVKRGDQLVMPAEVARILHATVDREALVDAAEQTVMLLARTVDEEPDEPPRWADWEPMAQHVAVACDNAVRYEAELAKAAYLLDRLAVYCTSTYRGNEAIGHAKRAVALGRKTHGRLAPEVGVYYFNLAAALHEDDRDRAAVKAADRSVAIRERHGSSRRLAHTLNFRADILRRQGEIARAVEDQERALKVLMDLKVPSGGLVELFAELANSRSLQGEGEMASELYEAAIEFADEQYPTAKLVLLLGLQQLTDQEVDTATATLGRAEMLLRQSYPRLSWERWMACYELARAHQRLGDQRACRRYWEEAVAINDEFIASRTT